MPSIVTDWMSRGLEWSYVSNTSVAKTALQPGQMFQLPRSEYIFSYPEGVILEFSAAFDDPSCGIRMELNPNLDTGTDFTLTNIALGLSRPEPLIYATVPPVTPLGWYTIRLCSQWPFMKWMRLYVFNSDTVPHAMLGHAYHLAVLKEKRKDESIVPLKEMAEIQEMLALYPNLREPLRWRMQETAEEFIRKMKLKIKLEVA